MKSLQGMADSDLVVSLKFCKLVTSLFILFFLITNLIFMRYSLDYGCCNYIIAVPSVLKVCAIFLPPHKLHCTPEI